MVQSSTKWLSTLPNGIQGFECFVYVFGMPLILVDNTLP